MLKLYNIDHLGYTSGLSPILGNSSEPASIDVYTSNSSVPLQSISISGSQCASSYVTSSPSPNVGVVQSGTITVLEACPVSSLIDTHNPLMPSSLSSSTLQLYSYLLPTIHY